MKQLLLLPTAFATFASFSQGALISSLPFATDFDTDVTVGPNTTASNTFYTAGTTSTAPALTSGTDKALRLTSPAGQNSSAAIQIGSILTSGGFTITMTFTLVATSGTGDKNIAIGFLGTNTDNDLSVNNNYRMNYGINTGIISFQNNGGNSQFDGAGGTYNTATWAAGADRPTAGDTVTLSLTATYVTPTSLSLSGTASTDAGAAPVTISAIMETGAAAYAGTNFGFRSGSATGNSSTIDITYFAVDAIPEPSLAGLLALSAGAAFARRRRI